MDEWLRRFERSYERGGDDDCWPWKLSLFNSGYGRFWRDGKSRIASRIAYEVARGPIPEGIEVCHSCDNPACVNPLHLFLGIKLENMADMVRKGRHRPPLGRNHGRAKLKECDVRAIRQMSGSFTKREIARHFEVSDSAVASVLNRRTWRHVL